jgi:hypothetical protein
MAGAWPPSRGDFLQRDDPRQRDVVPRSAGTLYRRRDRQDWPADRDFRILSIDGGGIRGILPLAMLARLERDHLAGRSIATCFDLVAGTSTGGIIALGLARGLTAAEILSIYVDRGGEVFPPHGRASRWIRGRTQYVWNRCDTPSLYGLIDEVVGDRGLWESSIRLNIPSAETRRFEPFIFKTPHHPDYRLDWKESMAHVAKTTSAAPAHFRPVVAPNGHEFIDGGVWANNPLMVAVADALACFDIKREQVKALSLGCGQTLFEMSGFRRRLGGLLSWTSLMFETMQIQSLNVVGQARLIAGGDRILRLDLPPEPAPIPLWDWARAKAELPAAGEQMIEDVGELPAKMFLDRPALPYRPIYEPSSRSTAL